MRHHHADALTEYLGQIKRTVLGMLAWGMLVVVYLCLTERTQWLPGLLLGLAASLIYYALLAFRIRQGMELPVEKSIVYMRIGWLLRLGFIVLVLILALRVPGIHFFATITGLFSFQIVMLAQAILLVAEGLYSAFFRPELDTQQQYLQKRK